MAYKVYIGLGSNLEDPVDQVLTAYRQLELLPSTTGHRLSPLYQSQAVGPGPQPDYINAVALIRSNMPPEQLLDALQAIEQSQGRVRRERWGPRTIDLDILLVDDQRIATTRLQVPHPYLQQRHFVLAPLADLAPDLRLPCGVQVQTLLTEWSAERATRL